METDVYIIDTNREISKVEITFTFLSSHIIKFTWAQNYELQKNAHNFRGVNNMTYDFNPSIKF